jgi:hypothetical protein
MCQPQVNSFDKIDLPLNRAIRPQRMSFKDSELGRIIVDETAVHVVVLLCESNELGHISNLRYYVPSTSGEK